MKITDKTLARLHDEKFELGKKLIALKKFLKTQTCEHLDETTSDLLRAQYVVMHRYFDILGQRIAQFKS